MNPDVLIVGAGPVGLFTAIEMKLLNPALNIKIVERNKEYTRHHILRLDESSLNNSEAYKQYKAVRDLHGYVPTSEIEGTFLTIAGQLGIEIERGVKVEDCNELLDKHPSAHTIIGADGARSKVRAQLFNDEKIVDTNLQYIVEIKYKVKGSAKKLPAFTYGPALGQVNHLVSENVGKMKEGHTPVSLFVFVSEKTYNEIRQQPNAKLADLKPNSSRMKQLLNTIQPWLSLRKVTLKEEMVLGSELINGVALNVYQSKFFAKELENNKRAYLVGDAGAAVPYFRALNAGLIAAAVTAKEIATKDVPNLEQLNTTLSQLTQGEISRAHKENKKVSFGRGINSFLAHASKLTTGALLEEEQQEAILNARVNRTNIFRRNPRITLSFAAIVILSGAFIPVFLLYALPIMTVMALSLVSAIAIVFSIALIVKSAVLIKQLINYEENPSEPLPDFPWETDDREYDGSFKSLSGLGYGKGVKEDNGLNPGNEEHFNSPLVSYSPGNEREEIPALVACL